MRKKNSLLRDGDWAAVGRGSGSRGSSSQVTVVREAPVRTGAVKERPAHRALIQLVVEYCSFVALGAAGRHGAVASALQTVPSACSTNDMLVPVPSQV